MTRREVDTTRSTALAAWENSRQNLRGLAVIAVAAAATFAVGIVALVASRDDLTNPAAWIALATIGMSAAAAAVALSASDRHGWAAVAAVVAVITPTGFAYLPNVAMLIASAIEVRLARRAHLLRTSVL